MKIYSLYILNKAGGLIYQNDVNPSLNKLGANDYLVLAGTLHGVHAIASKLTHSTNLNKEDPSHITQNNNASLINTGKSQNSDSNKSGLQSIETDFFNLYIFQTLTGLKFIIVTSPNPVVHNLQPIESLGTSSRGELSKQCTLVNDIYNQLYVLYSDYVMKDPFYSLDMPIKSSLFEMKVKELMS